MKTSTGMTFKATLTWKWNAGLEETGWNENEQGKVELVK